MLANVSEIFERGGRDLINFLEYCVLSINKDIVFLYVVGEYRLRPTASGATSIHDMFCAANAPAKISVHDLLAPKDVRLQRAVVAYRPPPPAAYGSGQREATEHGSAVDGSPMDSSSIDGSIVDGAWEDASAPEKPRTPIQRHVLLPPRYLFDSVAQKLLSDQSQMISAVAQAYDPALTPHENLPGGRLQAGQRAFVDNVWLPIVRPHLVAAGFWRLATVA